MHREETGAGKHHFGILPGAGQCGDMALQSAPGLERPKQATGWARTQPSPSAGLFPQPTRTRRAHRAAQYPASPPGGGHQPGDGASRHRLPRRPRTPGLGGPGGRPSFLSDSRTCGKATSLQTRWNYEDTKTDKLTRRKKFSNRHTRIWLFILHEAPTQQAL